MVSINKFFEEWSIESKDWTLFLLLILNIFALLFILTNFPEELRNSIIYIIMSIIVLIVFLANRLENQKIGFLGLGKNTLIALIAGFGAGIIIVFLNSFKFTVVPAFTSVLQTNAIFGIAYVAFFAPITEALAFRGVLMPSLENYFSRKGLGFFSGILAIVIQAIAFGLFHGLVYGFVLEKMAIAGFFAVFMGLGVYITRSIGFEWGAHFVNNAFAIPYFIS